MDLLGVSDKATGDRSDDHGGSCCKNGAIDRPLSLKLQHEESFFRCNEMEIHHHARNGALGYYPFTNAQLKELERQAMIYKYMMASVPVPFDLLLSSSTSPYDDQNGLKGGDMEPGRCRRTDGKKWRCSKDVVPNNKYCERHLHRGRPRSRKPVEPSNPSAQLLPYSRCSNSNNNRTRTSRILRAVPTLSVNPISSHNKDASLFPADEGGKKDGSFGPLAPSVLCSYRGEPRSLHWDSAKGEVIPMAAAIEQQPYSPMQHRNGRAASMLCGNYDKLSCSGSQQQDKQYLNFIDVWSNGVSVPDEQRSNPVSKSSVSSANGNLSLSSLALSTGGNKFVDDEMGPIQMSLGVTGLCQDHGYGAISLEMSSWLAPAATPGGPLAEILRPSPLAIPSVTVAAGHPSSPNAGDRDFYSGVAAATLSSSPSGVLKRTTVSLSDSSSQS